MTSTKKTMVVKAGNATAKTTTEVNDALPAVPCPDPAGYRYVGARYVPIFADPIDWNKNTTYEPLTIVVDEGKSYTSKTFVPAGIDIANTDYWALTGNYNAQVEQYRTEVLQYAQQMTEFENTFNRHFINGQLVLAFGDSTTRGYGTTNPETDSWPRKVCDYFDCTLHNFAVDGANFFGGTINAQVSQAAASGEFDNNDVAMILLGGGINDHGQNFNAISTGIGNVLRNINTNFPNAKVYFAPSINGNRPLDNIDQGDKQYIHTSAVYFITTIIKNTINNYKNVYAFTDAWQWLLAYPDTANDQVHPNTLGATIIANNIINFINNGFIQNFQRFGDVNFTEDIQAKLQNHSFIYNNMVNGISKLNGKLNFSNVENIPAGTIIANLPNNYLGRKNQITLVPAFSNTGATFLMFIVDGVLKSWTAPTAGLDYYFNTIFVAGM